MRRHLGLARINCPSCGAEQLVAMGELLADNIVECRACGEQEAAASVLGRYEHLAELAHLMRDLGSLRSGRVRRTRETASKEPA